jgi:hypothetical protein
MTLDLHLWDTSSPFDQQLASSTLLPVTNFIETRNSTSDSVPLVPNRVELGLDKK